MRKELVLPANCKSAFVAYSYEYQEKEIEVWSDEEDDYLVEVNNNGIIMFQMEELTNVNLKYYDTLNVDFYWQNCMNCTYRLYDDCIGGINVHRNDNCKRESIEKSEIIGFVERDIPEHLMMFNGDSYFFFVEHKDEAVALSLSNVEKSVGSWCTGSVAIDKLDINKTYDDFWNCIRNGDYTPSLYINGEVVYPTVEQLLREWSPNKLVFDENEDEDFISYHIDLYYEWLDNRPERHYLDFTNHSYYLTDYKPNRNGWDSYFIELTEGNYLEIL
jgi:hypothetical protein